MYSGADIKELRRKLDLEQVELAEKIGTTIYTVRYWEQNPDVLIKHKYEPILKELIEQYAYDENEQRVKEGFYQKIKENIAKIPFLRDAVSLYFAALDPEIPTIKKTVVFAALAYFIIPIDAIPDFIPIMGFTDDAAMIAGAITTLESILTQMHRDKAEEWLNSI